MCVGGVSYDQDLTLRGGIELSTSSISSFAPRAPDELDTNIDTDDDISGAGKEIARLLTVQFKCGTGWADRRWVRGHTHGTFSRAQY